MIFLIFAVLMALAVPIGLVLAFTAIYYIWSSDNAVLFESFGSQLFNSIDNYGLLAIPLFIFVGELMNEGGLTKRLIQFARVFFGGVRGGLAYINLLANMMMAAILGSAVAQIAIMAQAIVPEMEKDGYNKTFATSLTAVSGILGAIIPPSMMFVIFGVLAQVSIGDMFISGIIPGTLLGTGLLLAIFFLGLKNPYPKGQWLNKEEALKAIVRALPALAIPVVIILGILLGFTTPTESAGIACLIALLVGIFVYKELRLSSLTKLLERTVISTAMVVFLVAAAGVFGWTITFEQIPDKVAQWITGTTTNPIVFLFLVTLLLMALGTVLDGIAALILVVPILLPIATQNYGIDTYHFGVIVCIVLVLGLLTPPVGTGLFVASSLTGIKPGKLFGAMMPFLITVSIIVCLLVIFPVLTVGLL
ncbi:TRAP transporter large permease [Oligella urethralis]|uniref:TRAP transporter large permease n=1 Tax=Oligella urethralis TaxID=90245 RepID=UPI00035EABA0|nr:TRAP transporter large permease [Oligella urethralis]SUA68525.1 Neu5Ac permease [Oligella urethralis]